MCGDIEILWADACHGLEAYALYSHPNVIKSSRLKTVLQLEHLRRCYYEKQTFTLDVCLDITRDLQAKEQKDKIHASYGIFGLANPEARLPLDYSLDVHELYDNVARVLNTGSSFGPFLASFSMIEDKETREPQSNLLSWYVILADLCLPRLFVMYQMQEQD